MPYIITTRRRLGSMSMHDPIFEESHYAVATLEEVRIYVSTWITDRWSFNPNFSNDSQYSAAAAMPYRDALCLAEPGGTVGPLPDGTMIEVEQVKWDALQDRTEFRSYELPDFAEIIAAWNKTHA